MLRLVVANPNATDAITDACVMLARAAASPGTEIVGWTNRGGPPVVDSWYGDYAAGRPLARGLRTLTPTPDGVVLAGFGNYGTLAVKEALDMPVVALAEAAMATAVPLCRRFAIVTTAPRMVAYTEDLVAMLGFRDRCAAVTAVSLPPLDVPIDDAAVVDEIAAAIAGIPAAAGVDLIILGGARLAPYAVALRTRTPLVVLEPVACAVQMVESLIRLGLCQSKTGAFAPPPQPFEAYE